jgi:hypothetical protein
LLLLFRRLRPLATNWLIVGIKLFCLSTQKWKFPPWRKSRIIFIAIQIGEMHSAFRPAGQPAFGCPNSLPANLSRGRRRYCGIRPAGRKATDLSQNFRRLQQRQAGGIPACSEGRDSRESPLLCQAISARLRPFFGAFWSPAPLARRPSGRQKARSPRPPHRCAPRVCP